MGVNITPDLARKTCDGKQYRFILLGFFVFGFEERIKWSICFSERDVLAGQGQNTCLCNRHDDDGKVLEWTPMRRESEKKVRMVFMSTTYTGVK